MALPVVAIVGRPNVGKSSLLNMLARERISIVDPRAGITRDRVSYLLEYEQRYFELVDTGGVGIIDDDRLEAHIEDQIRVAIAAATVIVFVTDVRDGITPLDEQIAGMLRKLDKPVVLAANKTDDEKLTPEAAEFSAFGFGEPLPISAHHGRGRTALLDRLRDLLGEATADLPTDPLMKLAILGKRNAGKSTLVNTLAGDQRVIVSEIPGTTRDAVDVRFEIDGQSFIAIDTAGVRKRRSMDDVDFYSYTRAISSIRRADVVLYLVDATVPVSEVDLKLIRAVLDEYKPIVLAVNKWDLARDQATFEQYIDYLGGVIPAVTYAPITFITAQTGRNVRATVEVAMTLHRQATTRVPTAPLNAALQAILEARGPSPKRGTKAPRFYYATQVAVAPPTIVFFCNNPANVTENYRRYLDNRLRELLPFKEVPLRLMFRPRQRDRGA